MSAMKKTPKILIHNRLAQFFDPGVISMFGILQLVLRSDLGISIISPETIAFHMGYNLPLNRKSRKRIDDLAHYLDDMGLIEYHEDYYKVDTGCFYAEEGYELCDVGVFKLLMQKPDLLRHYLLIKRGRIDGKCRFSLDYFAKIENTSVRTISRWNKELEELQTIIIYQDTYNPDKNGRSNNVYVLYSEEQAALKNESYGDINRSVSQRYNSFIKDPTKFTPLQRKTLKKEVEEYNERNPDRAKDLSVFSTSLN